MDGYCLLPNKVKPCVIMYGNTDTPHLRSAVDTGFPRIIEQAPILSGIWVLYLWEKKTLIYKQLVSSGKCALIIHLHFSVGLFYFIDMYSFAFWDIALCSPRRLETCYVDEDDLELLTQLSSFQMYLFYLYEYFVCIYMCIRKTEDHRQLWLAMRVLGTEPRSLARANTRS